MKLNLFKLHNPKIRVKNQYCKFLPRWDLRLSRILLSV